MYKKLQNEFTGVLTGKGLAYGGSLIRPEATGYGTVYFAREMLATQGKSFEGAKVSISGSGNVAQFAAKRYSSWRIQSMSDSSGWIYDCLESTEKISLDNGLEEQPQRGELRNMRIISKE